VEDNKTEESVEKEPSQEFSQVTYKGRTFNTEAELHAFMDALSFAQGRAAQQLDEERRNPLRRYNLTSSSQDESEIQKKVEALREEGDHAQADRLMFEYNRQIRADLNVEREKERLWSDYVRSRPEVFQQMDEEMAKNYIFSQYGEKLGEQEDPLGLIDRVLKPRLREPQPPVPATLGGSNTSSAPKTESKEPVKEAGSAWDSFLKDELGVTKG